VYRTLSGEHWGGPDGMMRSLCFQCSKQRSTPLLFFYSPSLRHFLVRWWLSLTSAIGESSGFVLEVPFVARCPPVLAQEPMERFTESSCSQDHLHWCTFILSVISIFLRFRGAASSVAALSGSSNGSSSSRSSFHHRSNGLSSCGSVASWSRVIG
jgi:hypothetical protein